MQNTKLTELELQLLNAWNEESTFCAEVAEWQNSVWAFAVRDAWKDKGHNVAQLSGVISSLVKKDIVVVCDKDARDPEDHDTMFFTDKGAEIMEGLFNRFGA